jgi:TonB family protein
MKKSKITGWTGTLVLHAALFLLLWMIAIRKPQAQEEGGVPVMLGETALSQGFSEPYTMTNVDVLDEMEEVVDEVEPEVNEPSETEMITQEDEPSIEVPVQKPKEEPVKPKEKTEAEKRAEAERILAEKRAAEEKAAAENAAKRVAGAFGKGSQMGNKGLAGSGTGVQGSPTGNSSEGQATGVGGYGTFDLNGRSLGKEGLPRPTYNVQEEGRVVVTITVNPSGQVIHTSTNKRTNTGSAVLRRAAEEAARKAHFNQVDGVNNQTGTITYYFKLK